MDFLEFVKVYLYEYNGGNIKMSETRTYYYARVSTNEQSLDRQLEAFRQLGAEEKYIFTDKQSGKNLERTNYQILRNNILRSGDTLVIKSLDRLSRNKFDIKSELEYYKQNGIRVKVIDMPTTMIELDGQEWIVEMVNNIIIEVLSSVAEQERQETIDWVEVYVRWKRKEIKANTAMEILNLKRTTFYKLVNKYEQDAKWNI